MDKKILSVIYICISVNEIPFGNYIHTATQVLISEMNDTNVPKHLNVDMST